MNVDKRIIKTKTSIKNAFMNIMLDKELNKITISDIAEKALINRSTFYLHYNDVKSVMDDIDEDIINVISNLVKNFDIADLYTNLYLLFSNLSLEFEKDNAYKKYILYSKAASYTSARLKEILTKELLKAYLKFFPNRNLPLTEYKVQFVASGIIDAYLKWSKEETPKVRLEDLCKSFSETVEFMIKNV